MATTITEAGMAVDWSPLQGCISELRAGQEGLEQFVERILGELDELHGRLMASESRLAESDRRLVETQDQLTGQHEQLLAQQHKLQEAEEQLLRQIQAAGNPEAAAEDDAEAPPVRLAELEQERVALETELENVRQRAAELADELSKQKRQIAEERAEWAAELRQLRRVLDKQSRWMQQSHEPAPAMTATVPHAGSRTVAAGAPAAGDPVLSSVLSQFESLQRDLARRRAQKSGTR